MVKKYAVFLFREISHRVVSHVVASPTWFVGGEIVLQDEVKVQGVAVYLRHGAEVARVQFPVGLGMNLLTMTGIMKNNFQKINLVINCRNIHLLSSTITFK